MSCCFQWRMLAEDNEDSAECEIDEVLDELEAIEFEGGDYGRGVMYTVQL